MMDTLERINVSRNLSAEEIVRICNGELTTEDVSDQYLLSGNVIDRALRRIEAARTGESITDDDLVEPYHSGIREPANDEEAAEAYKATVVSLRVAHELTERADVSLTIQDTRASETASDIALSDLSREVDDWYDDLADQVADLVANDESVLVLQGMIPDEDDSVPDLGLLPSEIVAHELDDDDRPDDIHCVQGRWTCPDLDYWMWSLSLIAVAQGVVDVEDVQPAIQSYMSPWVSNGQRSWRTRMRDDELVNVCVRARQLGAVGSPPYAVLQYIGREHGLDWSDEQDEILTHTARQEAEDIFEQLT